jgi:hypothetical protein
MIEIIGAASLSEVGDFLGAIAWPLVALIAIFAALTDRGRRLLRPIMKRVRKISGAGFALELSPEAAAATKAEVEGTIQDFALSLRDEFERLAYAHHVRDHLAATMKELLAGHEAPDSRRATVHLRDALYRDGLYQLVDYWPAGGGADRRFSKRFGMLGRAWRLEDSLYKPKVPVDIQELIEDWGMTREQAERVGRERQSFFCGVLRDEDALVGVFYMDAKEEDAFPSDIEKRFAQSQAADHLATAVGRVQQAIADRGPGIKLLQSD